MNHIEYVEPKQTKISGRLSLVTDDETFKTTSHSLKTDIAQEWLVVFVVHKTIGEIMNYSLVGKARAAAKNTMRSKKAHCANIGAYACREASRSQKVLVLSQKGLVWVKGDINRPLQVA